MFDFYILTDDLIYNYYELIKIIDKDKTRYTLGDKLKSTVEQKDDLLEQINSLLKYRNNNTAPKQFFNDLKNLIEFNKEKFDKMYYDYEL